MLVYIAQGIGIVGLILAIISFQQNTNKGILLFQMLASIVFTFHFSLLGAYTGAAMNLVGAVRSTLFFNREKNWASKKYWLYLFIVLYIAVGAVTYKNYFSILPTVGMILSTIAFWIKNPKYTRLIMLPCSPCWLIYNFVNFSIAGVLTEIFAVTSLLVAMVRFDYNPKRNTAKEIA